MTLVEQITVGSGGAASIEFTGIPQDGKDLKILVSARSETNSGDIMAYLNGDKTSGDFSRVLLKGNGGSVFSQDSSGANYLLINNGATESGDTANTFSSLEIYIPNYAGSQNKSISVNNVGENNATSSDISIYAAIWADTSAVTSFEIELNDDFAEHTTASLYIIS